MATLAFVLLCSGFCTVSAFNFCVHKGETHPLNTIFKDKCNRCMCREFGVGTAHCTNVKCNKLAMYPPMCTHNCLDSQPKNIKESKAEELNPVQKTNNEPKVKGDEVHVKENEKVHDKENGKSGGRRKKLSNNPDLELKYRLDKLLFGAGRNNFG